MKLSDKCLYAIRACVQKTIRLQKLGSPPHANVGRVYHEALVEVLPLLDKEISSRLENEE